MNISCPNCKVKYDIPSAYFANGQQRVRCSNCAFEWEHRDPNSEHLQAQEAYREEVDDDPDPDIGEGFAFLDGALVAQRSTRLGTDPRISTGPSFGHHGFGC